MDFGSSKADYVALRFLDDERLADRLYWYLTEIPLRPGEEALAPVGPHDRLQRAVVERALFADLSHAPYDPALIKRVEAVPGDRLRRIFGAELLDFGGMKYDDRHYTRFGRAYFADTMSEDADMGAMKNVMTVFEAPMSGDAEIYRALLRGHGVLLLGGEGEEIFKILRSLAAGGRAAAFLGGLGFGREELARLALRLG